MSGETRELNWFGWSLPTIAAVYETDAAVEENELGLVNLDYVWAAWSAESDHNAIDRKQKADG